MDLKKLLKNYKTEATPKAVAGGIPVFCAHDAILPLEKLVPNQKNPNTHSDEQVRLLGKIIQATGWRQPITVSTRSGFIVKGHGRLMAARVVGLTEAPVDYQEYANEAEEHADMVADNRLAELSEIDNARLVDIFNEIDLSEIPTELTGYTDKEVQEIESALIENLETVDEEEEDTVPEEPKNTEVITRPGDIWLVGSHRVMCGDSTDPNHRALLFNGGAPQILLTDPPYCSGGFQESGKKGGSIGTDTKFKWDQGTPMIANDTLSTRGFQALIKQAINGTPCTIAYIFTDWRMWIYLFDLVEGSGFGVRNMIVWNKNSIGMGVGWRTKHELIMFGLKTKPNFDKRKGYGNVLDCKRSFNPFHPTQKPVELIEMLLDNTAWAQGVYDPFGGSGTTLIAAEKKNQEAYIMELEPKYVDTIVRRYILATGKKDVRCIRGERELAPTEFAEILDEIGDEEEQE